jgi:hypothetical protein
MMCKVGRASTPAAGLQTRVAPAWTPAAGLESCPTILVEVA